MHTAGELVGSAARCACSRWNRRCPQVPDGGAVTAWGAIEEPESRRGHDVARDGFAPHDRRARWLYVAVETSIPAGDLHLRLGTREDRGRRAGARELVGVGDVAPPTCLGMAVTGRPDRLTNTLELDLSVAR